MPQRIIPLVKNEIYHVYNKSIADFKIFNCDADYERMVDEMRFYSIANPPCKFHLFKQIGEIDVYSKKYSIKKCVNVIAYCIMPTHIHMIVKELTKGGITRFMISVLKSYSLYFNIRHSRKGPLWEGRFNNILIKNYEQFIHTTRYVHLNPVTAYLVDKSEDWNYSSYREYTGMIDGAKRLCGFSEYLNMDAEAYKDFVNSNINYQRELATIKPLCIATSSLPGRGPVPEGKQVKH